MVSDGDREVELFIRAAIADPYPRDGIVGEEHAPVVGTTGFVWVIDPIDGTANFVRGIPAWCVVIACAREGGTVVGVIHEPSTGETFHCHRDGGAFVNGRPIKASDAASLTEGSVGTGLSNRADTGHVAVLIRQIMAEGGVFYRNASGALMLAYAASGRLLGYIEEHMNAWDCLAGMLLVEEAGGTVLKPDPKTVISQGTLVIAGGTAIFSRSCGRFPSRRSGSDCGGCDVFARGGLCKSVRVRRQIGCDMRDLGIFPVIWRDRGRLAQNACAPCSLFLYTRQAVRRRNAGCRNGISCEQGLSLERLIRVLRACLAERLEQWQK
nr:inositol monophosphatase family protein [Mesorhizobium sp. M4A.F.Ca.ET.090.04.2.1]